MHYIKPEAKCKRNMHSKIELVVMLPLQPLITLCNVLLRVRSQDIRCLRFFVFVFVFGINVYSLKTFPPPLLKKGLDLKKDLVV